MINRTAYIISLKYSPGLKKEFISIGENLKKRKIYTRYLISKSYALLKDDPGGINYLNLASSVTGMIKDSINSGLIKMIMDDLLKNKPLLLLFYNPHPLNLIISRIIKKDMPDTRQALYLHEPYKANKSYYGFKKKVYIEIQEFIQRKIVKYMDYIILPSDYSSELFEKNYHNFRGKNIIAPLLIPDQRIKGSTERRFFSIVGNVNLATGHDTFINLVNYVAERQMNYEFCLISSSNICRLLKKLNEKGKSILKVINKSIIKESEINNVIKQSYAVFRLDREVTQSGVIPVAYMNKTPIIARAIRGLTQHVWDRETGVIVPYEASPDDLIQAMESIKNNISYLSENARVKYEKIWAEWNFEKYYMDLIELFTNN